MSALLAPLLSFLLLYKYWALFLIMFASSLILPFPTNSLLLAAGAFASQGYFNFPISLIVSVLANILGDFTGFFLARIYGKQALKMLRVKVPVYFSRFEEYIRKYPAPVIFFTRFFGTIDSVANILAGFVGVPFGWFFLWDFLGNFISTGAVIYIGYFLGINWQAVSKPFSVVNWSFVGFIVLILAGAIFWYRRQHHRGHKSAGLSNSN